MLRVPYWWFDDAATRCVATRSNYGQRTSDPKKRVKESVVWHNTILDWCDASKWIARRWQQRYNGPDDRIFGT
jgi:hypothetical protein